MPLHWDINDAEFLMQALEAFKSHLGEVGNPDMAMWIGGPPRGQSRGHFPANGARPLPALRGFFGGRLFGKY